MDRQEYWRQRYREIRPGWTPTTAIYASWTNSFTTTRGSSTSVAVMRTSSDRRWPTTRVVGIDVDERALAANEVIRYRVVADAERLRSGPAFDLVLMAWVLEHVAHPVSAFREFRRVLGAGGRIVFVTPNAWNYNAWLIRMVPNAFHAFFTSRL